MRNYEQVTQSEPIYTPGTISEVIFVCGQERCAEYDNLYFIDDAYIVMPLIRSSLSQTMRYETVQAHTKALSIMETIR